MFISKTTKVATAIDKDGEAGVRIRDICNETNTTAPSVYYFFGDRLGLIRAAQASRYQITLASLQERFADDVYKCKSKSEFTKLAHEILHLVFSEKRKASRSVRVNVLGNAQSDRLLARELADMDNFQNKTAAEPIRYAQSKG